MAIYTTPITKESFPEFWQYVWRKYGQAKRSLVIGKLIGIFGELVFLISMLFITAGAIYALQIPFFIEVLDYIPFLFPAWENFQKIFFGAEMQTPAKVAVTLLAAYGISIAFHVVMALLVYALYHPIVKKPSDDILQNANILAEKAHKAREYSIRAKNNLSTTCTILYLVLPAVLFTAVILLNADKLDEVTSVIPLNNMLLLVAGAFAIFYTYSMLDYVFVQISKWLFYRKVTYGFLADADRFRLFVSEETQEMGEEAAAAKRLEKAREKCEKALELEKTREYARSKILFHEASLAGDTAAMDHYARHCIIARHNEEAIYWLQCCLDTGSADSVTEKRLKDLKRGRYISVKYHG